MNPSFTGGRLGRLASRVVALTALSALAGCSAESAGAAAASTWRDDVSVPLADAEDGEGDADSNDDDDAELEDASADNDADTTDTDVTEVTTDTDVTDSLPLGLPNYGARLEANKRWAFRLRSERATRVELWLFEDAFGAEASQVATLVRDADDDWSATVDVGQAAFYGYRIWGPNWQYDEAWRPGSELGFAADGNEDGDRFNPNKLLLDPYALEVSHDPVNPSWQDHRAYRSGERRAEDTQMFAPKGVLLALEGDASVGPARALRDDVVYEVHVRGLTMADPAVPEPLRGTYAGAALRAPYLAELGVTAIELLPLHETQNEQNDIEEGTGGDNYWGYASLSFFAPERRYAADQTPGGPTREFREMVATFHEHDMKVFVDVVYNHTGEGGAWGDDGENASLLSWRGVDNAAWYQTVDGVGYQNNNGVGPNLRFTSPIVQDAVVDSLRYWHEALGVDGFRFDLASVLGNQCDEACFQFEANGLLTRIADELARGEDGEVGEGADLIAEPWGIGSGTYQLGSYPAGWAEWNDRFRIAVRQGVNTPEAVTPAELAMRIHGSSDRFRDDGRGPDAGVSYVVSHDGFTLADLFACAERDNTQAWPFGASDGGSEVNHNSDWDGDASLQRQAARTAFAIMAMSSGVPMLTGGDELLRTQRCNNNAYNLDSAGNWLDWSELAANAAHAGFVRQLLRFRAANPALRPADWTEGADRDEDGVFDIVWLDERSQPIEGDAWSDASAPVIAWMIDGTGESRSPLRRVPSTAEVIYVGWNRSDALIDFALPEPPRGARWERIADTAAWFEPEGNARAPEQRATLAGSYGVHAGSLIVLQAR